MDTLLTVADRARSAYVVTFPLRATVADLATLYGTPQGSALLLMRAASWVQPAAGRWLAEVRGVARRRAVMAT